MRTPSSSCTSSAAHFRCRKPGASFVFAEADGRSASAASDARDFLQKGIGTACFFDADKHMVMGTFVLGLAEGQIRVRCRPRAKA